MFLIILFLVLSSNFTKKRRIYEHMNIFYVQVYLFIYVYTYSYLKKFLNKNMYKHI